MNFNIAGGQKTSLDRAIRNISYPLLNFQHLDPLMERIGDAHYVLLGEASHGTHEYYIWRTELTKRLIREKGFSFIAVEGDWPDCYRLNRYVKGDVKSEGKAQEHLREIDRWPTWMWANWEVAALLDWLKDYNTTLPEKDKVGFYGLDVYSLTESLEAIINYLEHEDPEAANTARKAVECFDAHGGTEGQGYAMATQLVPQSCENEVIQLLTEIVSGAGRYDHDQELVFSTEQNANIAVNAERYYRAMISAGPESWNIRDRHMVDTLERLMKFHGSGAKCVVWEHNTHIGDARATSMARGGMVNTGQLVRESHKEKDVVLAGFGSYKGTVIAGRSWGAPMKKMTVPAARRGSWEQLLHSLDAEDRMLIFDRDNDSDILTGRYDHRAIGVVYNPEADHLANYVASILPQRYDAFLYIDETRALHPLDMEPHKFDVPETYPWGI